MNENSKVVTVPSPRLCVSPVYAAVALVLWGILTFRHGIGLKIASTLYNSARNSDFFHPVGGTAGFARFELFVTLFFIAVAAALFLPLLLLNSVVTSQILGHYPYYPFWDDEVFYPAFEVKDEDIWARTLEKDELELQVDEGVKIFFNDSGDEITYYQFDINPLNVAYDTFDFIVAAPMDYGHKRYVNLQEWKEAPARIQS